MKQHISVHTRTAMQYSEPPFKIKMWLGQSTFPIIAVLYMMLEGLGALVNWRAMQPLVELSTININIPGKFRAKPLVVFFGGPEFDAVADREVNDIWLGTHDKNYKSFKSAGVLRNPVTLDGSDGSEVCIKAAQWQSWFFPTCNSFHELELRLDNDEEEEEEEVVGEEEEEEQNDDEDRADDDEESSDDEVGADDDEEQNDDEDEANDDGESSDDEAPTDDEGERYGNERRNEEIGDDDEVDFMIEDYDDGTTMTLLGIGTSRDAWEVSMNDESVVLKTFHLDRKFSEEAYHHQILDSIASERLTSSPHIVDIYGFCGLSVLNELGGHLTRIRSNVPLKERLRYARDLAAGMADAHSIDGAPNALVVHADLRQSNVLISSDTGAIKLSDFNQGAYLGWNTQEDEPCGYRPDFSFWHDVFAAPEECVGGVQTEKSDVYHLGGMIFFFLTREKPYTFNMSDFNERENIMASQGKWPIALLHPKFQNSKNRIVATMRDAIASCLRFEAMERASAREIFLMLDNTLSLLDRMDK